MEKGSCSSWVVEMEKMREAAKPSVEMERWNRHSIYRVPHFIKDMTNGEAYSPWFVSLGPLHHGEPHLLPMEEHKRRAMLHMVNRSGRPLQDFVAAIDHVADELQAAYNDLDDKWRGANKGRFVEMMVMDGCFLLEWMRARELRISGMENDYATKDPIFSKHSSRNLWGTVRRDMICMENQIPLVVLRWLLAIQHGTPLSSVSCKSINIRVVRYLESGDLEEGMDELGLHFLDIFHKSYCGNSTQWKWSGNYEPPTPCAVELSEAGVQYRKSKSNTESIHDVHFENGVLSMPLFNVYDDTEEKLLNLMAFEWLHPDANFHVASYVSFLDNIIVTERDAALLRSEGVLANLMGSDKKVVEIFNTLTKLARRPMKGSKLGDMIWRVNSHCRKQQNKWRAMFMNTYLSNPWVFASTVATFTLLVAAVMQTVYTIIPFYTRKG